MSRRALITGVAGQDGTYLAEALLRRGYEVHGVTRAHPDDDDQPVPPAVNLHTLDVTAAQDVRALIDHLRPDRIFHLAAISSVARAWDDPVATAEVNGVAAVTVMDAAWRLAERGHDVRLVHASSAEIFGTPRDVPQTIETPLAPTNPYGVAKAMAHRYAAVSRARGLHCSALVLYPHESVRRPARFVSRKITQAAAQFALAGRSEPLALGNLAAARDWTWAPDVVEAFLLAAEAEHPDDHVVASGVAHTVRDFAQAAFAHVGITDWESCVRVDEDLLRPTDAAVLVGDPGPIAARLGWRPTVAFDGIVARMVDADLAALSGSG